MSNNELNATVGQVNKNHYGIKRIMSEMKELQRNPSTEYEAHPLEDNLFEWHFTIAGPKETAFEGGIYHGRIILPPEYPLKPPDIVLLTPNGRFETGTKICLSLTSYHPESWTPQWGIRTVLIALQGFFPTEAKGIGSIDYPDHVRRKLAQQSRKWKCPVCGTVNEDVLQNEISSTSTIEQTEEEKQEEEKQKSICCNSKEASLEENSERVKPTLVDSEKDAESNNKNKEEIKRKVSNSSLTSNSSTNSPSPNVSSSPSKSIPKVKSKTNVTTTITPTSTSTPGSVHILNVFILLLAIFVAFLMYNKIVYKRLV
ncbi:hypothetical protein ABK040_006866 [Willaertia magna]